MTAIRAYPSLSDYKEPFVKLVVAFLEQVLHIERASIHDISFEETYESRFRTSYFPPSLSMQKYAVTVRITPTELLGDKIYLAMEYYAGEYSISKLAFQPGWKPVKEQVNG